ncbi:MAG: rhomboid family intramembrane serine protease [Pseudomonadota bacterium]
MALAWFVTALDQLLGLGWVRWGVRPREWDGLVGIVVGPLIHGSFTHLLQNTAPIAVLGTALVTGYPKARVAALALIYVGSGLAVWCFARPAPHVGASGLALGMLTFVFLIGVMRRDRPAMALALIAAFLYGGMIWGIFPSEPGISYEAHGFGALMGVIAAVWLRGRDPTPPVKRYSWEGEPPSGDSWKPHYGPMNDSPSGPNSTSRPDE